MIAAPGHIFARKSRMVARYLVIGAGYTGERLARALARNATVIAVTGSRATASRLVASGLDARPWNLDSVAEPAPWSGEEADEAAVVYLVPPAESGAGDSRLERCLDALAGRPSRFVYVSTTGVYGDAAGGTVTEDSPIAPSSGRAARRVAAEQVLRARCEAAGVPWVILRVPGIYGPGRLPLERLRRSDPVLADAEAGPGNRIHVDDLVTVCAAAAQAPRARNRVYNVGDGNHASSTEYFARVARLAGLPDPPRVTRAEAERVLSPGMWSFMRDSRRVDTTRMRDELGVALAYHDLDAGIRASLP
jgi:nucleoside-diphosphate-sugar epimerase